ncbi:GNAT family N-acetyltransferase [Nitrosomonas sp.]|uniref:GNAT family N-acetyltransferase n=1 Tax=Nitrosomonas sp. TaxID=42353 RepID=UPI0025E483EF|nr:GNAT family N-acetyltransferase [Nitrosomonas sp.]MBY0483454.1 GNAT family N-acetyltransferase [Nitrosomonas sp.]
MCYSHSVHIVSWKDEALTLRVIRTEVFINEQQIPEVMEWDEFDAISIHVLACNFDGLPVGTARLLPDGYIGRMAVLKEWRNKGYGGAMLQKLLEELSNRHEKKVMLNAQASAVKFYEKFGFKVFGNDFWEAGILHVRMILLLN